MSSIFWYSDEGKENTYASVDLIVMILGFGLFPFVLLFSHLWTNDYMIYPLERNVFVYPSFRSIFTPTFTLLNRRVIEISDEWTNIRLKDVEETDSSKKAPMSGTGQENCILSFNK